MSLSSNSFETDNELPGSCEEVTERGQFPNMRSDLERGRLAVGITVLLFVITG